MVKDRKSCLEKMSSYPLRHKTHGPDHHFRWTGVSNELILKNAKQIAKSRCRLVIRFPLIPGINDAEENIRKTAAFARQRPMWKK